MSAPNQANKKAKDNMNDLNYFIKTLEKFSKSSNLQVDSSQQLHNGNQPPQIMSQLQQQGIMTLSSAGGTASAPQTPKDMIQGILMNLGDQTKAFNTTNAGNSKRISSKKGQNAKSKSSTMAS